MILLNKFIKVKFDCRMRDKLMADISGSGLTIKNYRGILIEINTAYNNISFTKDVQNRDHNGVMFLKNTCGNATRKQCIEFALYDYKNHFQILSYNGFQFHLYKSINRHTSKVIKGRLEINM